MHFLEPLKAYDYVYSCSIAHIWVFCHCDPRFFLSSHYEIHMALYQQAALHSAECLRRLHVITRSHSVFSSMSLAE